MGDNISFARLIAGIHGETFKRVDARESHGKSGKNITQFQHGHFICWDGEGIDSPRPPIIRYNDAGEIVEKVQFQLYALLMNNEGIVIQDTSGLSTYNCLNTIINSTDDKRAIHVCYGASYDVNMMLRDVPANDLRLLHEGEPIDYGKYQLQYRPRKSFDIREYMTVYQKYRYNPKTKTREGWFRESVTLWDVFSFFQSSFVVALEKYFVSGNMVTSEVEKYKEIISEIQQGKDRRGTFTEDELTSFVMPYTKLEVDALNDLMHRLHSNLKQADVQVTRWDGAGACASAILKKYKVKPHIAENDIPREVIRIAEYAFFGGRIETLQYGNYKLYKKDTNEYKKVYRKDINSAYPTELTDMVSLKGGKWKHHKTLRLEDVKNMQKTSVYLVSWRMKNLQTRIAPFPWRDKMGYVFFPPLGKAWVYKPELEMAIDMFKGEYECELYIHEAWEYTPLSDYKPFSFIPELYQFRQELISKKLGGEKEIKLALNALYGKTAQSVGYSSTRNRGKPPYHNMIVAGLTTSGTRAKLMRAAMQCPNNIIMLATDGIYSTSDIDVPGKNAEKKVLGEWEHETYDSMTIVASGVYWSEKDKKENAFSRGFDKYTVLRSMVLEKWERNERVLQCGTTRFVSIGSAISLNNFEYWCTWRTIQRELGLDMFNVAKRVDVKTRNKPYSSLVPTHAAIPAQLKYADGVYRFPYSGDNMLSHKYTFAWDARLDTLDGIPMREYLEECANSLA